jgi:hypothetical protein
MGLSPEELRNEFRTERGFNDLFELFRIALEKHIDDVAVYRELLWNNSLKSEELLFFAKRLGEVFPHIGFETYMWLADVFGSRAGEMEALELSFLCLKKASEFDSTSVQPYLNACDLFNSDLRIPTSESIIAFLKSGIEKVQDSIPIFERLSVFYKMVGNDEMFEYYKRKSRR